MRGSVQCPHIFGDRRMSKEEIEQALSMINTVRKKLRVAHHLIETANSLLDIVEKRMKETEQ
jgi:hypothetical protein